MDEGYFLAWVDQDVGQLKGGVLALRCSRWPLFLILLGLYC